MAKNKSTGITETPEQAQPPATAVPAGSLTVDPAADAGGDDGFFADIREQLQSAVGGVEPPSQSPQSPPDEEHPEGEEGGTADLPNEPLMEPAPLEEDEEPAVAEEEDQHQARPEWPQSAYRRVAKQTKRIKQLEEQLAQLRGEGQPQPEEEPADLTPDPGSSMAQAAPVAARHQQAVAKIAQAEEALRIAQQHPDGGTVTLRNGKTYELSPEQIPDMRENAQVMRLEARAELREIEREAQREAQSYARQAAQAYPWLTQKTSQGYQLAAQVLREMPGLRMAPDHLLWVADAIAGRMARERQARAQTPPPPRPANGHPPRTRPAVKPPAGRPRAVPAPSSAPVSGGGQAWNQFLESGDAATGKQAILGMLKNV